MLIHILQKPATPEQMLEMLQANRFYIKTVVDIRHRIWANRIREMAGVLV